MEWFFALYIFTGVCLVWSDRDKKPMRKELKAKGNVIYVNFPRKKKVV